MSRKIAYLIGFLISVGYIGLVAFAPKWLATIVSSLFFIGAATWVIGSMLSNPRQLPKIKGESDD